MTILNMNIGTQKILLWLGLGMAAIYGFTYVFLLDFLPPPSPTLGHEEVIALYSHSNVKFRFGVVLMIFVGAFYLPISVTVAVQMARLEKGLPLWAILQALASTIGAWIFAFPAVLWGVAAFTVSRAPEVTVALHELAWLSFVTPSSVFTLQLIPIGVVSLVASDDIADSAFPRWFGWFTIWACVLAVVPTFAQMFTTGPLAWNGLFSFYLAVIIYAVWLALLGWLLLRALSRQRRSVSE